MSVRLPGAYSYRKTRTSTGRKNNDPEHQYQVSVAGYLKWACPKNVIWTASAAGVRITSIKTAADLKAAGQHRGWADLQFLNLDDGVTRYCELKWDSSLSDEQKLFRDHLQGVERRTGLKLWCLARKTLEDMDRCMRYLGMTPLVSWDRANRYDIIRDA
jgi:hypothetical protein